MSTWQDGPPRTAGEGWVYAQREEALKIAVSIVGALAMARAKAHDPDEWAGCSEPALDSIADDALAIAVRLLRGVDDRFPRTGAP